MSLQESKTQLKQKADYLSKRYLGREIDLYLYERYLVTLLDKYQKLIGTEYKSFKGIVTNSKQ